jgi:hypothetical protein
MSIKWTAIEIEQLTIFVSAGVPDRVIAQEFKRSPNAIKVKRRKLKLTYPKYRISEESRIKMRIRPKGDKSHSWKGGRRINYNGYIEVFNPDHPRARGNGYVFEHIIVAEEKLGRPLRPNETVHHIDHDKQNNIPENLQVETRSEHTKKYHKQALKGVYLTCPICQKEFYVKKSHAKIRKTCGMDCAKILFSQYYTGKPRNYRPTEERKAS